jgi:hypothetical protein
LFTHFGQFISHDITYLSTTTGNPIYFLNSSNFNKLILFILDSTGTEIECPCGSPNPVCMDIPVSSSDQYLGNRCYAQEGIYDNPYSGSLAYKNFNMTD